MSLINQMLRDLDERHAPSVDRAGLPPNVHVLPPEPKPPWRLAGLSLGLLVAAGVWYLMGEGWELPPPPPVAVLPRPTVQPVPPVPPVTVPPKAEETIPPVPAPPPEPAAEPQEPPVAVPPIAAARPIPPVVQVNPAPQKKPEAEKIGTQRAAHAEPAPAPKTKGILPPSSGSQKPEVPVPAITAAPAAAVPAAIDKRPRNAPANEAADGEYRKAMSAVRRGAITEAIAGLYTTLKIDPRHVSGRQALLSLLVEQQLWDDARALLEEGLSLDPAQSGWAMAMARLQFEHGKLTDAVDTLARYSQYAEQNADYQAFHALLLQKQKRGREAVERYRAALALKPMESRWWYGLGLTLEADQKPQEAREAFLKARETGNLSPEVANALEQKLR